MKKFCVWCKKELGGVESGDHTNPITHGICSECAKEAVSVKGESMSTFLDKLPGPIYMLNSGCEIISANAEGARALGKDLSEFAGKVVGKAFECKHAGMEGGCGENEHCRTCTIRNSILDTYETGKSILKVPAYPDIHEIISETAVNYLISTEKVGEAVIVKVDKMV